MKKKLDILDKSISPRRLIVLLVLPSFIDEFMSILVNYVDTAMVGSIGIEATASTALTSASMFLTNGITLGLGMGFSVIAGRYIGEGKKDKALDTMRQSIYLIGTLGILFTLIWTLILPKNLPLWMNADPELYKPAGDYIFHVGWSRILVAFELLANNLHRAQGDTKTSMVTDLLANATNCIMNFLLIYPTRNIVIFGYSFRMIGAGMGVKGAAVATSLANVIACVYSVSMLFNKRNIVPLYFDGLPKFDVQMNKHVLTMGIPVAAERTVINFGQLCATRLVTGISTASLAAYNLAATSESLCFMSVMGFGTAATSITAQWLGAGDSEYAVKLNNKLIKYSAITMLCASAFLYIFAPQIIDIFTDDAEVIALAARSVRIMCYAEVFSAIATTLGGFLRGAGDVRFGTISSMVGMWGVRIPLAFILINYLSWDIEGVWLPMAIDWVVRFIMLTIRYKKGKWKQAWKIS